MRSRTDLTGRTTGAGDLGQPVLAGIVTAVVGFTSSFAVLLTGLTAVGASPAEASSGLFVCCLTMGVGSVLFSLVTRTPVTLAWSTPGAALLAGAAAPDGGYASAVGAFAVAGLLYVLTGLFSPLARLVRAIPLALANAMLAGVLLVLCVQPFRALVDEPAAVAPVLMTWLVLLRVARRWAVPGAFAAAVVVIAATGSLSAVDSSAVAPQLTWTAPGFDPATVLAIGIPLYLVTMTSQNIPGAAVLASFGYDAPLRPALFYAGGATVATAGLGGYSINLAAISAALAAGPEAHPDPGRRWVAGVSTGVTHLALGPLAAAVAAVAVAAPPGLVAAVAGVALLATFGSAAASAMGDADHREAATVTFVVAASGVAAFGVGAAFWSLLAGGLYLLVMGHRTQARACH
ncbi:benzoate/H(+) symporter BenE family transporter [Nocardioides sp. cx-173]|uniref:benzoate/H(+) symporter BenE family transporter n=1 Tax=Nocardioides sp. cx-173 TaxID=2898796 RepID=UPI001E3F1588|nr:benzoate/H(+) symporter BenE family transporter [Nocardioides sp. cx-173]MCD4525278.1 benzoate/H(+) symporter BenE family transporter [Nocardioides sp. cx-173]UGB40920.1 benzoate/H(+) symporter BenE family transporter [Nocardioides sp. cx-173]